MYKRSLEVDCRGKTAFVEERGSGPTVVMVGAASPMALSRPASEELARLGFHVVDFDYGSDAKAPEPRTMLDQAEDVLAVMDAVGVTSATLVGLSRAAMTTYALAAHHPERVAAMVLVFPVAGFADTLFLPVEEPGDLDGMLEYVFSKEFLETRRDDAMALFAIAPGGVIRVNRDEEEPFPDGMSVSCPTLVLEGGEDLVVSNEHPARYLEAIPEGQHHVIPGAAHAWILEQSARLAALVSEFVTAHAGSVR